MSRAADLAALIVDVNTTEAKTDELTGKTSAGSIAVTGEGGSTTTNLQQGLAKQWVNFNGTGAIAARDSLNNASLTDNGTGDYNINFTNATGNNDYAVVVCSRIQSGVSDNGQSQSVNTSDGDSNVTTTTVKIASNFNFQTASLSVLNDSPFICIGILGDLA